MSAVQLIKLWRSRDALYAVRKTHGVRAPLTTTEQDSVRAYRRTEVETLVTKARDQERALGELGRWTAPSVLS